MYIEILNWIPNGCFWGYLNRIADGWTSQSIAHNQSRQSKYFLTDYIPIPKLVLLYLFLPPLSITNLNSFKTAYSFYKRARSTPGCQTCLLLHPALLLAVSTAYLKTRCFFQLAYASTCPFFQENFLLQRFYSTHPLVGNQSRENLVLNKPF